MHTLCKDNTKASYVSVLKSQKKPPEDETITNQGKIIFGLSPPPVPRLYNVVKRRFTVTGIGVGTQ